MKFFVEIILPIAVPRTFTYSVSETEFQYLKIGARVVVPFGKTKMYTGLVSSLHHNEPTLYEAKEIHQIIDKYPIVNGIQLQHWNWIASYYMCSIGEVFRSALPSALLLESESIISQKQNQIVDQSNLSDEEYLLFEALNQQSSLKIAEVVSILNKKNVFSTIQSLLDKNVISLQEEVIEEYKPKLIRYIRLFPAFDANDKLAELLEFVKNAPKQKELILGYFQLKSTLKTPISVKKIIEFTGSSAGIIKTLIDKNVFEEYYIQQDRVSFLDANKDDVNLHDFQNKAFQEIETIFTQKDVCLLHGVTASGKTEVYIKLINQFLQQEMQILYLLPEIA